MYGFIAKVTAKPGAREALSAILLDGTGAMPGCISYVVALDQGNGDVIWVTETWESKEAHAASLALPHIKAAIAKAMPRIAGFDRIAETTPIGGIGLPAD